MIFAANIKPDQLGIYDHFRNKGNIPETIETESGTWYFQDGSISYQGKAENSNEFNPNFSVEWQKLFALDGIPEERFLTLDFTNADGPRYVSDGKRIPYVSFTLVNPWLILDEGEEELNSVPNVFLQPTSMQKVCH